MKNARLLKPIFTFATLLMLLQISACSTDKNTEDTGLEIIPVSEANSAAVISGTDKGSIIEDVDPDANDLLEVSGKLNITDKDAGEVAFFATTINGNYGSLKIDADGNWSYSADNNQPIIQQLVAGSTLNDRLTVSSLDGTSHVIVITIFGTDEINPATDIVISWTPPTERENNAPITLSEISGYKIYFGSAQGQYPDSVAINNSNAMGYTFSDLSTGAYYFVLTTIDTEGRESGFSPEIKKII